MSFRAQAAVAVVYDVTSSDADVTRGLVIIANHPPIAAVVCAAQEAFASKSTRRGLPPAEVLAEAITLLLLLIRDGQRDQVPTLEDLERGLRRGLREWGERPYDLQADHAKPASAQRFSQIRAQARKADVEPTIPAIAKFIDRPTSEVRALEGAFMVSRMRVHHCNYAVRTEDGRVVAMGSRKTRRRRSDEGDDGGIGSFEDLCDQHDRCGG